jgi:uncharacterized membrane protein YjjP (DUF1212 family)
VPPAPLPADTAQHAAAQFVLALARALHRYGYPAHRLEEVLGDVATRLRLESQFFTTPTSIFASFGPPDGPQVHLLRVEPGEPNLGHLSRLDDIMADVVAGRIAATEGSHRIAELLAEPPRWSERLTVVAFVAVSAAIASLLRLTVGDALVAALLGLVTGLSAVAATRVPALAPVFEPFTAFSVTTVAFIAAAIGAGTNPYLTAMAGLIVLLPGLSFTIGLTELSTRHLSSGTARLAGALVTFLGLGFGVAFGARLGGAVTPWLAPHLALPASAATALAAALPTWTEAIAYAVGPLCFVVLLRADRRDAGWIVGAGVVAALTTRFANPAIGEELGAFLGALVVSTGGNLVARWRQRTAMILTVPGLLMLVPGSIGFRSVTSLLGRDTLVGVEGAFRVGIVGISLAAGFLAGNVLSGLARPEFAGGDRDDLDALDMLDQTREHEIALDAAEAAAEAATAAEERAAAEAQEAAAAADDAADADGITVRAADASGDASAATIRQ